MHAATQYKLHDCIMLYWQLKTICENQNLTPVAQITPRLTSDPTI